MQRTLWLHEITDMLETNDDIDASAIVMQPYENATSPVSDEDSEDEEGGTINNLPDSLLRAPAHLVQDGSDSDSDPNDPSYQPENDYEVASTSTVQ
ncbi:unnamed protein product [Dicrocoelium dendriticum]|nr:unnamed protein product [Dicrocoelium dendriticum]